MILLDCYITVVEIKMNDLVYTIKNKRPKHPHKADNKSILEMHLRCAKEPSPLYELEIYRPGPNVPFIDVFHYKKKTIGGPVLY